MLEPNLKIKEILSKEGEIILLFDDVLFLLQLMTKTCGYNISEWTTHSVAELYQELRNVAEKKGSDIPKLIFKLKGE